MLNVLIYGRTDRQSQLYCEVLYFHSDVSENSSARDVKLRRSVNAIRSFVGSRCIRLQGQAAQKTPSSAAQDKSIMIITNVAKYK